MSAATTSSTATRHRPKSLTVFAAAFIAGAAAAVGVNRVLDVHLAQRRPQVECEPIFVALRPLPQGASVTVWDVALKDWPKAMLPSSALRAGDSFDGFVLRHAVREGQPLLAVQLIRSGQTPQASVAGESFIAPAPAAAAAAPNSTSTQTDPWMPAESLAPPATTPVARTKSVVAPPSPAIEPPAQAVTSTPTPIASKPTTPQPKTPEPTPTAVAAAEPAASTPAASTPAAEPAAEPARAAAPPATAIAATSEPTPAEPTAVAAARQPIPPSPTDIDAPTPRRPSIARVDSSDDGMEEAVATDVQSMPSVMTSASQSASQSGGRSSAAGDAARYLVVPERIALQADTSFTTPRPEPPGPPAVKAATRQPSRTPAPPAGQPPARRGQQPPRGQQASGQPARGQQQPQSQQPATAEEQRTWSGMFPNVAAGIEAMGGSWQRSRSGSTQPATENQPTRR
ncbi:MAG: hypothetical protein DWH83_04570 [Planctomycetota bacterium]|nr:MAG: hypothetical protein DWH83_04570 [Planctomycetota bacterium]